MKTNFYKLFYVTLLLLCATIVKAHDFYEKGFYWKILSESPKTVAVTYEGDKYDSYTEYSGQKEIPANVTYNGVTYTVKEINNLAFRDCKKLTNIIIPESVTSIGIGAFYDCSGLTSVVIPNSVTGLGGSVFRNCTSLTSVTIPNSVTDIEDDAFYNCTSLTSITIPESVTGIGSYAFYDCSSLTSMTIPSNVTNIKNSAFSGCSNLLNITICDSIATIGKYAFNGCKSLKSLTIPKSVETIEVGAFDYCRGLNELYVEDGTTTLNLKHGSNYNGLFSDAPIETLYLGRRLEYDDCSPFFDKDSDTNTKLKTIIIGKNGGGKSYMFKGCTSLQDVYVLSSSPTNIDLFRTSKAVLHIPYGTSATYKKNSAWNGFSKYVEFNQPNQCSHTPTTLYICDFIGNIRRWESSRDGGSTWSNIDCTQVYYTESAPERGEVLYRALNTDGVYSDILTINYYDAVPSAIATIPANETKTVEGNITFTLNVKDDGYTYQWMHNDVAIEGATSNTYTIPSIKADDAGKYYCAVSNPISNVKSTTSNLVVNKCQQTISIPEIETKIYGDEPFELPAKTNKGLTINYQSTNTDIATVEGNIVTIKGVGETNIIATQSGNDDYLEAAYVSRKLTVKKISQTITFEELSEKTYEDISFALPEKTDKGLVIKYQSTNTNVATIEGNIVTIVGAGKTDIIATQEGDTYHYAAAPVSRQLTVNRQAQTMVFDAFGPIVYGNAPIILNQYTNKNLEITYTSSNTSVATVDGNKITIVKPGVTVIKATQNGTSNYLPVQTIERTLVVDKASQKIEWYELEAKCYGDEDFALPDTTDRGLTINYVSDNTSVATIDGNVVSIKGAGVANITAKQNGNDYYNAATSVTLTLIVSKSSQAITFAELQEMTYGDAPIELMGTTNSSDIIKYSSSDESVATISGNILTVVGAGKCTITASCDGNNNYYGATSVQRELVVNKAKQVITLPEISGKIYGDEPFAINTELTSDQPISFVSSNASVLSIRDSVATIRGAGRVVITATQDETRNYETAMAQIEVVVDKAELVVSVEDTMRVYGDENPNFTISYKGFVNGDTKEELDEIPIVSCVANKASNTGDYNIVIKKVTDKNYKLIYNNGILKVKKAPLIATPTNATKFYGDKNPNFTIEYSGFKNNQNERELLSQVTAITTAKTMSPVGEYAILAEGGKATNYEIVCNEGTLTIEKAPLTVTLMDIERTYGETNEYKINYKGFKGSDNKEVLDTLPSIVCEVDKKTSAGLYSMTLQGGSDENYKYIYTYERNNDHAVVKINKALLWITAEDKSINYQDSLPIFTVSYDGFVNDDTEASLEKLPEISCEATSESLPGTYSIILYGGYDNNYEYVYEDGILTIVAPSGIGNTVNDNTPMQIYTLRGVLVYEGIVMPTTLTPGTYIIRSGNTTKKIYIE